MPDNIDNTHDTVSSRDVIDRIAEIEYDLDPDNDMIADDNEREDLQRELRSLSALAEQAEHYAKDWRYGAVLVRDSYFTNYAKEYAESIDATKNVYWPLSHIDWDAAADDLKKTSCTSIDFDGVTYWVH